MTTTSTRSSHNLCLLTSLWTLKGSHSGLSKTSWPSLWTLVYFKLEEVRATAPTTLAWTSTLNSSSNKSNLISRSQWALLSRYKTSMPANDNNSSSSNSFRSPTRWLPFSSRLPTTSSTSQYRITSRSPRWTRSSKSLAPTLNSKDPQLSSLLAVRSRWTSPWLCQHRSLTSTLLLSKWNLIREPGPKVETNLQTLVSNNSLQPTMLATQARSRIRLRSNNSSR